MKKQNILLTLSIFCLVNLASCAVEPEDVENTYTVIWQDYNGDILELDRNVKEGSVPTYDGTIPSREANDKNNYVFAGWSPVIREAYENTTYTATYTKGLKGYTITWINEDGTVLEVDSNVAYGTLPTYDGSTPLKEGNETVKYIFKGWDVEIDFVKGDATYTATYKTVDIQQTIEGTEPELSSDGKKVLYGYYPQTHIKDTSLIATLNALEPTNVNGWYLYEGVYYTKEKANIFNNESYKFEDGTSIINDVEYWYSCDKIEWDVISNENGTYTLLSSILLDTHEYYDKFTDRIVDNKTVYSNNYKESNIRSWLNDEFYSTAFALNNIYINQTSVNNGGETTNQELNLFWSENTLDNVYLLSYQDYLNTSYGFLNKNDVSNTRTCKASDYVRANGAWCNTTGYTSTYWTRSPSSKHYYAAWNVNSGGYLSSYSVDGTNHCVRPSITISL